MSEPLGWVLCAPMRVEAAALRRGLPGAAGDDPGSPLLRTGMGPARSRRAAAGPALAGARAVAVAGVGGGLQPFLAAGDVVVADRVRPADGGPELPCAAVPVLVDALRRRGLTVYCGPVCSARRLVRGGARRRLAATGALAVDTESGWLLGGPDARPRACVRVVADSPPAGLFRPATLVRLRTALRRLPAVAAALAEWAGTLAGTLDDRDQPGQIPPKEVRSR